MWRGWLACMVWWGWRIYGSKVTRRRSYVLKSVNWSAARFHGIVARLTTFHVHASSGDVESLPTRSNIVSRRPDLECARSKSGVREVKSCQREAKSWVREVQIWSAGGQILSAARLTTLYARGQIQTRSSTVWQGGLEQRPTAPWQELGKQSRNAMHSNIDVLLR
jgi:hypothetical protein